MKASQMVKVRGVKRYCEFQSLSLTANHKVILIPGQLVKCFRTLLQRVHRSLSSPYKRKTPHKRGLSGIFFRLCAYAGLRFRCTTPPESSIRQCHRHTPLLQRFGEHTPLLTLHYYYTQPKGICQLGSFFFETEVVARYSSLRPEFTTKMK